LQLRKSANIVSTRAAAAGEISEITALQRTKAFGTHFAFSSADGRRSGRTTQAARAIAIRSNGDVEHFKRRRRDRARSSRSGAPDLALVSRIPPVFPGAHPMFPGPRTRPTFRTGFAHPLDELRDELDRLWTTLTAAPPLHGWGVRPRTGEFPAVNVAESPDCITVEAEVPGLDAGDVDVAVSGDELVLKGSRPEAAGPADPGTADGDTATGAAAGRQGVTWHRRERGSGSFERRLTLPAAVDATRVEAKLVDGVLTITCPKAAESQPRKVTVQAG